LARRPSIRCSRSMHQARVRWCRAQHRSAVALECQPGCFRVSAAPAGDAWDGSFRLGWFIAITRGLASAHHRGGGGVWRCSGRSRLMRIKCLGWGAGQPAGGGAAGSCDVCDVGARFRRRAWNVGCVETNVIGDLRNER
jgi:hypothetical protein